MARAPLIVIGASAGGMHAIGRVLSDLPEDLRAAVLVTQHRSSHAPEGALVHYLQDRSALPVSEADDKETIEPGHILIAPADYHLLVEDEGSVALSTDQPVLYSRPSIDVLFESAADAYGAAVIGVVLTGANADGAAGLARIRARGGNTVVQDPATAESRAMPEAAIKSGDHVVLPLDQIGGWLVRAVNAVVRPAGKAVRR